MPLIHRALHLVFRLLFGDYTGVQVFLYPMTLFCWIDGLSFSFVITGLLTIQRHFFPLFIFILLFMYIAFLIIKNHSNILSDEHPNSPEEKRIFGRMVINVHLVLFVTLICFGILYVLATFLSYYYHIRIPLKLIYPEAFRFFSIMLILYFGTLNYWMQAYRKRNISLNHAQRLVRRDIKARPLPYALYAVFLCLFMVLGSYVYSYLVLNLIFPITLAFGFSPQLLLIPVTNIPALLYDVLILGAAFMLSNLLFSPLSLLISHYASIFHPYNLRNYAQKKKPAEKTQSE